MLTHNGPVQESEFEPLELIGYGSFGSIRKVRRRVDNQILVRKEILYRHMNDKERGQLVAELTILSGLKHDNIVQYFHHEHLEQEQVVHLYMDYCPHGDLGQVIREHASYKSYIPEDTVWNILSQLVSALYRCHMGKNPPPVEGSTKLELDQQQHQNPSDGFILHRDIKPDNIFLGPDWTIKLGDFGLAKVIRDTNIISTSYVGTPIYMSPEVLDGLPCTTKGDIWAFGCVIYELCTLEPPFNSNTLMQLSDSIHKSKYRPIPEFYSPGLSQVIAACLQPEQTNRPTVEALIELPVVKIWRRNKQIARSVEALSEWESRLIEKEKELSSREAQMVEWQGKQSILEESIKSRVQEQLAAKFEAEVQARIQEMSCNLHCEPTTGQMIKNQNVKIGKVTAAAAAWTKFYSPIVAKHNGGGSTTVRENINKMRITDSPMDITMLCSPKAADDLFTSSPLVTKTHFGLRIESSPLRLRSNNRIDGKERIQSLAKSDGQQSILGQLDLNGVPAPFHQQPKVGVKNNRRKLFRAKSTIIGDTDENEDPSHKPLSHTANAGSSRINRRTQSFAGATFTDNTNQLDKKDFANFR